MKRDCGKGEKKGKKLGAATWHWSIFLASVLLALLLCPSAGQAKPAAADSLRIIYGGSLLGTVKPCG